MITAIVLVGLGIVAFVVFRSRSQAAEFFTEPILRGPIRNAVNATGTVQAVLTVQVGSQVSGQIQALYADYNSIVKRGQLLAKIDPRTFQAQVEQAKANLLAAQARVQTSEADLKTQQANLQSSKANLEAARVTRDNTAVIFKRYQDLQQSGVVSQNDYDTAKANSEGTDAKYNQAASQVQQMEAQVNSAIAQVAQAKAQVEQTQAALNQAQANLDYTSINSPVDGVVISRNVDVGQTVAASLQAPILFVIANDLTKMQVNASVDEADIGNISNAADVRFTVDAYPNRQFAGRIAEIRLNPQTVQNVVTYSVIINVDNQRLELKPGMTANITITVAQQDNVVKVPNAALRYLPPGVTREQVAEMLSKGPVETASLNEGPPAGAAAPEDSQTGGNQNLSPEERQARFRQMQQLPPEERQRMRESFSQPGAGRAGGNRPGQAAWGLPGGRGPAAETAMAPGQMWDPALKIQFPSGGRQSARPAVVWVLGPGKKPAPRQVLLGITDGSFTQVLSGELKEGDNVIVGDTTQAAAPATQSGGARSPVGGFGGGPPGGGRFFLH
ncbi:MAG: efflux RND transporter periplasmic adaptor subunit [Acidobacteria bacterium]|nr:efflux RND transporter periplasmic adaptor subunit [Acidobacteriota bacterium]